MVGLSLGLGLGLSVGVGVAVGSGVGVGVPEGSEVGVGGSGEVWAKAATGIIESASTARMMTAIPLPIRIRTSLPAIVNTGGNRI
jgi:hypothetical protein